MRKETQAYFEKKKEEAKQARSTGNSTAKSKWGNRGNVGADKIEKRNSINRKMAAKADSKERKAAAGPSKSNSRGGFKKGKGMGPRAFKKAGGYKGAMKREAERLDKPEKTFPKKDARARDNGQSASGSKNSHFNKTENKGYRKNDESATAGMPNLRVSANRISLHSNLISLLIKQTNLLSKSVKTTRQNVPITTNLLPVVPSLKGLKAQALLHQKEKTLKGASKSKADSTRKKITVEKEEAAAPAVSNGTMPLNKFIAHAGVCSRRDAADVVRSGKVVVNGKVVTEPGFKVTTKDEIKVNGKQIAVRRNLVYILLNKPKDYITTTEDPQGRKTVLDIVRNATTERVYPIGRLDRNTTGVLLLTNDGELAQKLSHPSYEIKKDL